MNEIPTIKTLIEPLLNEKGYSLYDLKFRSKSWSTGSSRSASTTSSPCPRP